MGIFPFVLKYFKLGFRYLFSSNFLDETKSQSIDFFKRDDLLISPRMEKYLDETSNEKEYINNIILKRSPKQTANEEKELAGAV